MHHSIAERSGKKLGLLVAPATQRVCRLDEAFISLRRRGGQRLILVDHVVDDRLGRLVAVARAVRDLGRNLKGFAGRYVFVGEPFTR
jgi:hypothetical protein